MSTLYKFELTNAKGEQVNMSDYQGQVLLIVNTASACGFTPQYEGLEKLQQKYKEKGFTVLAFPCNQFKQQESGSMHEIQQFCDLNFNISFPLFEKIDVNGDNTAPLFHYLKHEAKGILGSKSIKWNFTKFLISADGKEITRFAPMTKPAAIESDIEKLLRK